MKFFYAVLAAVYVSWFVWYGGSGEPLTQAELDVYIASVAEKSSAGPERLAETTELMHRLAAFDTGNVAQMSSI